MKDMCLSGMYFREDLESDVMARLYSMFLVMRPESWKAADQAWITPTEAAILNVVCASRRPMCISDIARELHCARPTVSRAVASLEYKCYVLRKPYRRDRRKTIVTVGPPGRLAARWARRWDERMRRTVRTLPANDLEALYGGLGSALQITRRFDRRNRRR
jgi:DNA-binding MarR family transcriptional regulator